MEQRVEPLYLRCSRGQALTTWTGAYLNAGLVLWSAAWLLAYAAEARPAWPVVAVLVLAGLFVGDWFTGVIHWVTDTWFDEVLLERVVSIAREHHLYPHHIVGYSFRDYVGYTSWPAVVFFGPVLAGMMLRSEPGAWAFGFVLVCGEACALSFFGTHFHRFGHRRSDNPVVKLLQRAHILITPQYHARHHGGTHTTHYCVVNGWANVVCDAIGFWRGLEQAVRWLTAAEPRQNDKEWFARFRVDRSFMTDPIPSLLEWRSRGSASSAP
jgi:ubiquitin-conjugating enzyme E2 variant